MKLPISISPCPIREAVAEVRFEPSVPEDAVFGIVYQALKPEFSEVGQLPILSIPAEVRKREKELVYQPYYRLESPDLGVLVGPRTISVGMRGEYPGWRVHSARIKSVLSRFHGAGVAGKISRLGLRYISFFEFDIFPRLQLRITVNDESWDGEDTVFTTVLTGRNTRSLLQIRKGIALVRSPERKGSVIDIDSFAEDIEGDFGGRLDGFLESGHESEKALFFQLLKPEFLATLNPVYEDAN